MLIEITSDNPCGDDIKYNDVYIEIETEIEKHFNASNTAESRWDVVIRKSEDLLKNYSKDLKLLSYWLYAQKRLNGWDAFLASFEIYIKLLETYNKDLHPKSEKRKVKLFEWMENVLEDELLISIESFTEEQLIRLSNILKALKSTVPLTIKSEDTFFKDSQKKCSEILQKKENEKKENEKLKEAREAEKLKQKEEDETLAKIQKTRRSEEEEILAKLSSSSATEIININTALTTSDIDNCQKSIIDTCQKLFKKSPIDYFTYKLLFTLGETTIEESFHENSNLIDTLIPSNDIIQAAREMENSASSKQLNALIEQLLLHPAWLEGYYIVSKILYKLSRKEDAKKLENMLFYFLHKELSSLTKYKMIPETMNKWLQAKNLSMSDGNSDSVEYKQVYQEVLKIKKEQSEQNALTLLEDYYHQSKNKESRFRWKLVFVDFALEIGDKKLALSLLLELEKLIEIHSIDQWQPELAITTYEILLKPILMQELQPEIKDRIYNKLSILDIKKVIKLH